jgi:SAM-dependent MidA family methyltransferase
MATKADNSSQILKRLERLENKLFGNGESLVERVTRLEAGQQTLLQRIEEYHLSRKKDLEEAILKSHEKTNELLTKQVREQLRQNRMQLIGLWITIASLVGGFFASKALGWLK